MESMILDSWTSFRSFRVRDLQQYHNNNHKSTTTRLYQSSQLQVLKPVKNLELNSRLQEAQELLSSLLGLVGDDGPVGLSLHAPQTHRCLCCGGEGAFRTVLSYCK